MNSKYLCLLFFAALLFSCRQRTNVERAFYYWKNTSDDLNDIEIHILEKQSVQKLYVKFFEVEYNEEFGLVPVAKSSLYPRAYSYQNGSDSVRKATIENLRIVPTVYIRNNIFSRATTAGLDSLADNIVFLIDKFYKEKYYDVKLAYQEIQIDCDWTPSTRDQYFYVLKQIKKYSSKTLSATLRLYPYKYPDKMGILPVDKAMLMCYNLHSPLNEPHKNSILNEEELKSYLENVEKYPVHLDLALPVYQWVHWYHNNRFEAVLPADQWQQMHYHSKETKPLWRVMTSDLVVGKHLLKAGDKIKMEEVPAATIEKSISLIQRQVSLDDSTTVALFHFDEKNLSHYTYENISGFYTALTR